MDNLTERLLGEDFEEALKELEALDKAATPGPWVCSYRGDGSGTVHPGTEDDYDIDRSLLDGEPCLGVRGEITYEDGVLASALRNALPDFMKAIRELHRLLATAKAEGAAAREDTARLTSAAQRASNYLKFWASLQGGLTVGQQQTALEIAEWLDLARAGGGK